ncbi:MAG: hypothetical protein AAGE99_00395 [Chlamydiota bacterium]
MDIASAALAILATIFFLIYIDYLDDQTYQMGKKDYYLAGKIDEFHMEQIVPSIISRKMASVQRGFFS